MLFKPSELRARLQALGKRPDKKLSQNFLIDGNILKKIVALAEVKAGDSVVEIGAGPGALTQVLLQTGAHVIAIEKDTIFATALEDLQTEDGRLEVISADFLTLPLESFLSTKKKIKVVANLPYQITTPIITRLVPLYTQIQALTLMVQKEVALRFIAQKGSADYSSFTLFLQYYADIFYGFNVTPTCFYPAPKVHSAVVQLVLKPPPAIPFPEKLIRRAFQQRRKMLRTSLKDLPIEPFLKEMGLNPQARPEELSLSNFLELSTRLSAHPSEKI